MIPDGARVEYHGKGMMLSNHRLGQFGTVVSSYKKYSHTFGEKIQVVKVQWDNSGEQSVFANNVDRIETEPTWEV